MSMRTRMVIPIRPALLSLIALSYLAGGCESGTQPDVERSSSALTINQGLFNNMGPLSSEGATSELLFPGQFLNSQGGGASGCGYGLIMQHDGNLVLYGSQAWWATGTNVGTPDQRYVRLQGDGNFVLYDFSGTPLWATNSNDYSDERLYMQTDGNLVLYRSDGSVAYATGTNGRDPIPLACSGGICTCSTALVPGLASETTIMEEAADRPGGDYSFIASPDQFSCANSCVQDRANCLAYSWIPAGVAGETGSTCALKNSVPAKVSDGRGVVTGYIRTRILDNGPVTVPLMTQHLGGPSVYATVTMSLDSSGQFTMTPTIENHDQATGYMYNISCNIGPYAVGYQGHVGPDSVFQINGPTRDQPGTFGVIDPGIVQDWDMLVSLWQAGPGVTSGFTCQLDTSSTLQEEINQIENAVLGVALQYLHVSQSSLQNYGQCVATSTNEFICGEGTGARPSPPVP